MDLRPLEIFFTCSAGIDFSRQNSDVCRRQILTSKVYPRAVRVSHAAGPKTSSIHVGNSAQRQPPMFDIVKSMEINICSVNYRGMCCSEVVDYIS